MKAADRAALPGRVQAALTGGAWSWVEVARRAGCSRTWARQVAAGHGWDLADAGARDVRLSVRVRSAVAGQLEAEAAREGVPRSEMHRRLLGEALRVRGYEAGDSMPAAEVSRRIRSPRAVSGVSP